MDYGYIERLLRDCDTGCLRMCMLREVECQHERFCSRVFNFHAPIGNRRLSDESDFRIDRAENHILVITHFELSNATASAVRVE